MSNPKDKEPRQDDLTIHMVKKPDGSHITPTQAQQEQLDQDTLSAEAHEALDEIATLRQIFQEIFVQEFGGDWANIRIQPVESTSKPPYKTGYVLEREIEIEMPRTFMGREFSRFKKKIRGTIRLTVSYQPYGRKELSNDHYFKHGIKDYFGYIFPEFYKRQISFEWSFVPEGKQVQPMTLYFNKDEKNNYINNDAIIEEEQYERPRGKEGWSWTKKTQPSEVRPRIVTYLRASVQQMESNIKRRLTPQDRKRN